MLVQAFKQRDSIEKTLVIDKGKSRTLLSSQKTKFKRQEAKSPEKFTATAQFVKEGYSIPAQQCSTDKAELALI